MKTNAIFILIYAILAKTRDKIVGLFTKVDLDKDFMLEFDGKKMRVKNIRAPVFPNVPEEIFRFNLGKRDIVITNEKNESIRVPHKD